MFREEKVATCFVRQIISWNSNESRRKHENIALKSNMTKRWNSLLPQWNYLQFTREFVCISHLRSVGPKSYKPGVRPKSTSDEILSVWRLRRKRKLRGVSLCVFSKCRWCGDYFTGRNETTKTKMTINGVYLDHGHDHDRKLKLQ